MTSPEAWSIWCFKAEVIVMDIVKLWKISNPNVFGLYSVDTRESWRDATIRVTWSDQNFRTIGSSVQFNSVQSLSRVWLFATLWIAARQASLSITNSRSLLKLMSIESVMPSSHLIFYRPLLRLPPIPPSIRVFSSESTLRMRWPSTGVSASSSILPMIGSW